MTTQLPRTPEEVVIQTVIESGLANGELDLKKQRGHSTFQVCNEMKEANTINKRAEQFGQREATTPALP